MATRNGRRSPASASSPTWRETARPRGPRLAAATGGLPRLRYAEDFERFATGPTPYWPTSGHRPTVFLATLGPVAAHTARAGFAGEPVAGRRNRHTERGRRRTATTRWSRRSRPAAATIACLCGTDKAYASRPQPLAAALKAAGAATVLLAGPRNDEYPSVDTFLYRGCDALAVLRGVWDVLEGNA